MTTASDVAAKALRRVGAYPPMMRAPNPAELQVALEEMDGVVRHLAATHELPWVRRRYRFGLAPGQGEYDLTSPQVTGESVCAGAIEKWDWAYLVRPGGEREPLRLLFERGYLDREREDGSSRPGAQDDPHAVWIERGLNPRALVLPVPRERQAGLVVEVAGQHRARDLAADKGRGELILPPSWELYLINAVACEIGAGPVRRLPQSDADRFKAERELKLAELVKRAVPEHRRPRVVEPWTV